VLRQEAKHTIEEGRTLQGRHKIRKLGDAELGETEGTEDKSLLDQAGEAIQAAGHAAGEALRNLTGAEVRYFIV
jgi:hypothetical protein